MENESAQLQTNQNPLLDNIGKTINPYLEMLKGFQNDMVKASGNPLTFVAKAISDKFIYDPKTKRILPSSLFYPENRDPLNMVMAMSAGPVEVGASKAAPSIIKGTEEMIETPKYTSTAKGKTFFNPITRKVELQLPSGSQAGGTSMIIPRENVLNTIVEAEQNIANKIPGWEAEVGRVQRAKEYLVKHYGEKPIAPQTAKTIVSQDPTINMKRDLVVKDVHGQKATLPAGDSFTPYVTDKNQIVLKDDIQVTINKNQYQNVRGNAIIGGTPQEFAPELKGTTETVKGEVQMEKSPYGGGFEPNIEDRTKFSRYTLPGGKNYREILIQAPHNPVADMEKAGWKFEPKGNGEVDAISPSGENLGRYSSPYSFANSMHPMRGYQGAHWDEPNVLAHIRLNDRVTPDGKPVTFMEELQSDWERELRAEARNKTMVNGLPNKEKANEYIRKVFAGEIKPDIAFDRNLKDWQTLAVKRGLKDAAENGSEYFAWTTGAQQQARYDLSKQVESIKWNPIHPLDYNSSFNGMGKNFGNDTRGVFIFPKTGQGIRAFIDKSGKIVAQTGGDKNWIGKNISEVIGKGIGDRIAKETTGTLAGEGLNIGGEWANNLYDKQVKDLVEKVTGGKVETIDLGLPTGEKQPIRLFRGESYYPRQFDYYDEALKPSDLKVGETIRYGPVSNSEPYIITEVVGERDFKALPKWQYDSLMTYPPGSVHYDNVLWPNREAAINGLAGNYSIPKELPKAQQQAIRLTPEIRAKILGQEAPIKQPSGQQPVGYVYDPKLKKVVIK